MGQEGIKEGCSDGSEDGRRDGIEEGVAAGLLLAKSVGLVVGFEETVGIELLPQSRQSYFRLILTLGKPEIAQVLLPLSP